MAEQYNNLGSDITKAVEHVLSSKELQELKNTVRDINRSVEPSVRAFGDSLNDAVSHTVESTRRAVKSTYSPPNPPRVTPRQSDARLRPHQPGGGTAAQGVRPSSKTACNAAIGLGIAGVLIFGIPMLGGLATLSTSFGFVGGIVSAALALPTVGCALLMGWGLGRKGMLQRLDRYRNVLEGKKFCPIATLAKATGKPDDFVVRDVQRMLKKGVLREGYLDDGQQNLILDYETYQQYLATQANARKLAEQRQQRQEALFGNPQGKAILELEDAGNDFLVQIRALNAALPDPEVTARLDTLEQVCRKIFGYVEQHPEKLPQIRKFMSYYLPTTLKLMEAYRELDRHGDYASVAGTRAEIRDALGNINRAFENLFENLLQNDMLNLSADISALETMLAQEGLSPDDNFK